MLNFLLFSLAGLGITNLIVNSSIFESLREYIISKSDFFGKLISCMTCTGFWVGVLLWILLPDFISLGYIEPICFGAVISLIGNFYDILTDYMIYKMQEDGQ